MTAAEFLARAHAVTDGATSGPWTWRNTGEVLLLGARSRVVMAFERMGMQGAQPTFRREDGLLYPAGRDNINSFADAAFIAASRTLLPAAVTAIEAVLALHERVTRWGNEDYSISQDAYDDVETGERDTLTAFDVCAECFRIEQTSDQHDGAECEHAVLDGLWPCPTSLALDGLS